MKKLLLSLTFFAAFADTTLQARTGPLLFLENKGQISDQHYRPRTDIDFVMRSGPLNVFVGSGAIYYQFRKLQYAEGTEPDRHSRAKNSTLLMQRMDVELLGANKNAKLLAEEKQQYYEQYYTQLTGEDGALAQSFARLRYIDIYPGIDWLIYCRDGQLEYEFVVKPGADPRDIRIKYSGAEELALQHDGSLLAACPLGSIREARPYSYTAEKVVPSAYRLEGDVLSFELGAYTGTLTIDPTVVWDFDCCGPNYDIIGGIALDAQGGVYCSGTTAGGNIATTGAFQSSFGGMNDAYLVKLDNTGTKVWGTYFGAAGADGAAKVYYDNVGALFMCGATTSTTGMASSGAFQTSFSPTGFNYEAMFLAKFSLSGARLWSTYYGGDENTQTWEGLACDESGNAYICGRSNNPGTIATPGTHQPTYAGNWDGFIAKFNGNGNRVWGTYFGGIESDNVRGIAYHNGHLYVGGYTYSSADIATPGSFQDALQGSSAGMLAKFDTSGQRIWGSYYRKTAVDDVVYDNSAGTVFFAGTTADVNDVATPGAYQENYAGGSSYGDVFIAAFTENGSRIWASYLGGNDDENLQCMATDNAGSVYLTGYTKSTVGSLSAGNAYQASYQGGSHDGFFARFAVNGLLMWASYFGTNNTDACYELLPDGTNTFYLGGLRPAGTYSDGFVVKFSDNSAGVKEAGTATETLSIYPNPSDGHFYLESKEAGNGPLHISLRDVSGRIVYEREQSSAELILVHLGNDIPAGLYLLELKNSRGISSAKIAVY